MRLSKNLSLRASAHTGVAIRSPKCSVFIEFYEKSVLSWGNGFPRPLRVLGMTFFFDTLKGGKCLLFLDNFLPCVL